MHPQPRPARQRLAWIDDVELAVATYVDWYNHRRLHGEIGYLPPAEHETDLGKHHDQQLP